jgi:hypothetical protein
MSESGSFKASLATGTTTKKWEKDNSWKKVKGGPSKSWGWKNGSEVDRMR